MTAVAVGDGDTGRRVSKMREGGLKEHERRILDFEAAWPPHHSKKNDAILTEFSYSPARYYQVLNRVISTQAAHEYNPILVRRLHSARFARESGRVFRCAE